MTHKGNIYLIASGGFVCNRTPPRFASRLYNLQYYPDIYSCQAIETITQLLRHSLERTLGKASKRAWLYFCLLWLHRWLSSKSHVSPTVWAGKHKEPVRPMKGLCVVVPLCTREPFTTSKEPLSMFYMCLFMPCEEDWGYFSQHRWPVPRTTWNKLTEFVDFWLFHFKNDLNIINWYICRWIFESNSWVCAEY